jgi:hypothetical protein
VPYKAHTALYKAYTAAYKAHTALYKVHTPPWLEKVCHFFRYAIVCFQGFSPFFTLHGVSLLSVAGRAVAEEKMTCVGGWTQSPRALT